MDIRPYFKTHDSYFIVAKVQLNFKDTARLITLETLKTYSIPLI